MTSVIEKAKLDLGHPKWATEIKDNLNSSLVHKLEGICSELGALGAVIYIRFDGLFAARHSVISGISDSEE
jgi:hypothetical protein